MAQAMRVGLIGFGAIGQRLARGLLAHPQRVTLSGVLVQDLSEAQAAAQDDLAQLRPLLSDSRDAWLEAAPDLVVECAGHTAVDAHAEAVLGAGCDLLLVSVGALTDDALFDRLRAAATATLQRGARIGVLCPSDGDLSGLKDPDRRADHHRAVLVG